METTKLSARQKKRYLLNKNQRRLLMLIYKFRFATVPLLQEYLGIKHRSTIWHSLQNLQSQGYITSFYDKSYIRLGKPAVYFLDNPGLRILKQYPDINTEVLRTYYKNKSLSEEYRQHSLDVLAVYNALKAAHPDKFYIFTKNELNGFAGFPDAKPDLYVRNRLTDREYFVTIAHDLPPFLIRKRLSEYIAHSEDEGWTSSQYPSLLFVCKTAAQAAQLLEYARKTLENAGIDDDELRIATTTFSALTSKPYTAKVWSYPGSAPPRELE